MSRARADQRQSPASDRGGDDEQHRDQRGDAGQDDAARDRGVDVGVSGARDRRRRADRGLVGQRRVLVEPDADGLEREVERGRDGQLDACRASDPHLSTGDPDAAVEVVGRESREAGDDDRRPRRRRGSPR